MKYFFKLNKDLILIKAETKIKYNNITIKEFFDAYFNPNSKNFCMGPTINELYKDYFN